MKDLTLLKYVGLPRNAEPIEHQKKWLVLEKVQLRSNRGVEKVAQKNVFFVQLKRMVHAMWTPNERNVNAMCTERKIYTPLFYTPLRLFTFHFRGFTLQHGHLHSSTSIIFENLEICQFEP